MTISSEQKKLLFEALYYCKMAELKRICQQLNILLSKGKGTMIDAIKQVIDTGKVPAVKEIPVVSRAQKEKNYPLAPNTLILYGSYKNDLKTREFFKKLIGAHFHFTAFGIDWINARWYAGKPPTYQEFAQMWQREYERRKKEPAQPKKEWAYINFLQNYGKEHPAASAQQVRAAWEKVRAENVKMVHEIVKKLFKDEKK